jgi:hypothetical protein
MRADECQFLVEKSGHAAARLMGQWLSERLGQQFVIENRAGGGTNIGITSLSERPVKRRFIMIDGRAGTAKLRGNKVIAWVWRCGCTSPTRSKREDCGNRARTDSNVSCRRGVMMLGRPRHIRGRRTAREL